MPDQVPRSRAIVIVGIVLLLGVLAGGTIHAIGQGILSGPEEMADWVRGFGPWAPALLVLLMVAHSFAPVPGELLALAAGTVFGPVEGAALIWIGAMIGAVMSFWLARWLGRDFVASRLPERQLAQLEAWSRDWGALTLLSCRLMPVIAFNLINYAAGLMPVRFWTFLWTTAIGILPFTLLMTWLGARIMELSWPTILAMSGAAIALTWWGYCLSRRKR
ncbi:TVP38/TMEM64 family protein [Jhaorihella thermophila]|uniref:TVP38/TMEM64 family membrane protein n=1 Tax=Jhaorihella thermophila TaxID=488547 RepID=A0A1H5YEW7_9RHOB|nr:TVP38/TMEM64 family protein [Jhaorihella thermophila]SEG21986.1 Uncharacterized membrane protein YdjX, TVP38/TMEM64 family, SNARE-associated domain [Jhaorihella thermophila]